MAATGREPPPDHLRRQPPGRGARDEHRHGRRRRRLRRADHAARRASRSRWTALHLPMAGQHNVLNALAAIAVARELGVPDAAIRKGLAGFGGVRRRFTTTGEASGVRVIDDYGHHPVEIASVLKAARAVTEGRVIAVVQPHRYSRLRDLFDDFCRCFNDADVVIVADVYPAGEAPIEGVDRDALVEGLRRYGHRHVLAAGRARPTCRRWSPPRPSDGRPGGLPGRRRHHRLGLRPAGAAGRAARRMSWRERLPARPRQAAVRRAARALHLVPRRRAGRRAVPARGRGRPGRFPARACRPRSRAPSSASAPTSSSATAASRAW